MVPLTNIFTQIIIGIKKDLLKYASGKTTCKNSYLL